MERKGFHVPCNNDLDCFSRCGTHPVSGMHYVCTQNVSLYTNAGFGKDAYTAQVAANVALKAAGEPHPRIWLPDDNNQDYYLLDMPGTPMRPCVPHTHTHTHPQHFYRRRQVRHRGRLGRVHRRALRLHAHGLPFRGGRARDAGDRGLPVQGDARPQLFVRPAD